MERSNEGVRKHQAIQLDQMSSKIGTARVTETQQKEGGKQHLRRPCYSWSQQIPDVALKKSCSRSQTEFTSLEEVTKLPATMATFEQMQSGGGRPVKATGR